MSQRQEGGKGGYSKNQVWSNPFPVDKSNLFVTNSGNLGLNKANTNHVVVKKPLNLTSKQIQEKRLKNLCFWCDEKFSPKYKCKYRQLYMLIVQDDDEWKEEKVEGEGSMEDNGQPKDDNPQLSLDALEGTYNFQTIRLKRVVGKKRICILIDSGSTHNFLDAKMVGRLGCVMEDIPEFKVMAANGNELFCKETCKKFSWIMQGQQFLTKELALPLDNYDLVLGIQWLVELGDITWNFKELNMKFKWIDKECMLKGE